MMAAALLLALGAASALTPLRLRSTPALPRSSRAALTCSATSSTLSPLYDFTG